jgi:hypothetical protein
VNTASQNLGHHLGILQEKLQHPTDYELALNYFLEEFAGDAPFIEQCDREDAPHLVAVLGQVAMRALGKPALLEQAKIFRLPQFKFDHGSAAVAGRVMLFFYFEPLNMGLAALIPGVSGAAEVCRFRLPGGLTNPKHN